MLHFYAMEFLVKFHAFCLSAGAMRN